MNIIRFPKIYRARRAYEPLEWEPCNVPLLIRLRYPRTNFGQMLRAKKDGKWVYRSAHHRDYG